MIPKKKPKSTNNNQNGNGKNGNGSKNYSDQGQELESSNAQTTKGQGGKDEDEAACYCCGDKSSRLWRCNKKDKIAPKNWHKPEHAPKSSEKEETKVESSHTSTVVEFSGAQRIRSNIEPSEEILDSGSTVTLGKRESEMKNLRDVSGSVVMTTNAGDKGLEHKGD